MKGRTFIDGQVVDTEDARMRIDDLAVLRGFSIYEGITTVHGVPFMLEEHLDRFERSAHGCDLSIPYSREELTTILTDMARSIDALRGDLRLVLTAGITDDGITPSHREQVFVIANPLVPLPDAVYTEGVSVISLEHQRMYPEYKTSNYITAVHAQKRRKEAGATEILYVHGGHVLEASTSNLFIVKNGVISTPKDDILHGITRMKTIALAREAGLEVREEPVTIEAFYNADEIFLTSSFKDVLPVVWCDEREVGGGKVGSVTKQLIERYKESLAETIG